MKGGLAHIVFCIPDMCCDSTVAHCAIIFFFPLSSVSLIKLVVWAMAERLGGGWKSNAFIISKKDK